MKGKLKRHGLLLLLTVALWGCATTDSEQVSRKEDQAPLEKKEGAINGQAPSNENTDSNPGKKDSSQQHETENNSSEEGPNDPLEPLNRLVFAVNDLVDFVIVHPVAEMYRAIVPQPARNGVTNFLDNIFATVVFLNHVLQGEPERATVTVFRLITNSTIGLFGMLDAATELGYPRYDTDFNQTLLTWGVDTGPYLVLPLIGPSSFRGTVGYIGDYFADPLNLYLTNRHHHKKRYWLTIRYGVDMVSHREKLIETLDNLSKTSLDKYVTMRSIYFQRQTYLAEKLKSADISNEIQKEK